MTQASRQCREFVVDRYPGVRISRLKCKVTASGGISQHSAYGGDSTYDSNAIDIMGGPIGWTWDQNVELIQAVVDDLTLHLDDWSIRKILWQTAFHYGHAHIDFWPMIVKPLKWCGGPETPTWRLPDKSTIKTRNPKPINGLYTGEDMWISDITDATWTQWYNDGHIQGNAEVMPQYYFTSTTSTKDSSRVHAFNVAMRSMSRRQNRSVTIDTETVQVVKTVRLS